MATRIARLLSISSAGRATDRRRNTRHKASGAATITNARGDTAKVRLTDVSQHGCAVTGTFDTMRVGAFITITLGSDKPVQGIIRWLRDGSAGIEFLWPLPTGSLEWNELINRSTD